MVWQSSWDSFLVILFIFSIQFFFIFILAAYCAANDQSVLAERNNFNLVMVSQLFYFLKLLLFGHGWNRVIKTVCFDAKVQPYPQGLLAFQYGSGRREDPGTQQTKMITDWCIPWCIHTCALIGLLVSKQRRGPFEGFMETEKCMVFEKLWHYLL